MVWFAGNAPDVFSWFYVSTRKFDAITVAKNANKEIIYLPLKDPRTLSDFDPQTQVVIQQRKDYYHGA